MAYCEGQMRIKCDNEIEKGEKKFTCGRFLGKVEGMSLELKCPNCKKVHRIEIDRPIDAKELVLFLESNLNHNKKES